MMNRKIYCRVVLFVLISIFFSAPAAFAIILKGASYTAWDPNSYASTNSDESLARAKEAGCTWISINLWWFQDDIDTTVIGPDYDSYSATPESVIHAISRCHELGLKVVLKPNIDVKNSDFWRGQIIPSTAWFAAYHDFINFWADIANAHSVELFCVGCEYVNTQSKSASWRSVIQDVRTHYDGPLTYAANHGSEQGIDWWDELDYIGIDAYYVLTDQNDPTFNQLKAVWNSLADNIESWLNTNWPTLDIIFTEVGYSSIDGTNTTPWSWTLEGNLDLQEQADCYEALLSECSTRDWWLGAFWWNWETDPDAGGLTDTGFTPQNKPAQQVISNYYITVTGDFDDDKDVDLADLVWLADYWLEPYTVGWPDLDGSGVVNMVDFAIFSENWLDE